MESLFEKYGYTPDKVMIGKRLDVIAANIDNRYRQLYLLKRRALLKGIVANLLKGYRQCDST